MAFNAKGILFTIGSGYGTGVAQQGQITSFTNTSPLWVLQNKNPGGGPSIWPSWLRLFSAGGTQPTGTLQLNCAVVSDIVSMKPTSAGTSFTNPTPANADARDSTLSVCTPYVYAAASALTIGAPSASSRNVARASVPTGVSVTGDEYVFQFGLQDQAWSARMGLTAARATDLARIVGQAAGFNIAPNTWASIYLWWVTSGTTVPTWEWELGWYEL